MTNEEGLKSCPFCGSVNIRTSYPTQHEWPANVTCKDCACTGPLVGTNQFKEAIEKWNTRQTPEKIGLDIKDYADGWNDANAMWRSQMTNEDETINDLAWQAGYKAGMQVKGKITPNYFQDEQGVWHHSSICDRNTVYVDGIEYSIATEKIGLNPTHNDIEKLAKDLAWLYRGEGSKPFPEDFKTARVLFEAGWSKNFPTTVPEINWPEKKEIGGLQAEYNSEAKGYNAAIDACKEAAGTRRAELTVEELADVIDLPVGIVGADDKPIISRNRFRIAMAVHKRLRDGT